MSILNPQQKLFAVHQKIFTGVAPTRPALLALSAAPVALLISCTILLLCALLPSPTDLLLPTELLLPADAKDNANQELFGLFGQEPVAKKVFF